MYGVAVKIYNVGRLGFFVRAQPKLRFGRHRHVFIYSARKTLAHLGKKHDSPILIGRNVSRRRPGKMTCRCLKKNHHRMTSIEHFLIDIIQILSRDWIENTIADIGRCKTATDIFRPTLRNFVYKRRPIIFFYGRGFSFVGCCRKNLQCRSARFFRVRPTEVFFQPTPPCFHLLGKHNICPPRKKALLTDTDKKKNPSRHRQGRWTDPGPKKKSPCEVDQTFPNRYHPNIIQGLNSQNNSQHKSLNSRDCYFSAGIAQVLLQTLADNIFLR